MTVKVQTMLKAGAQELYLSQEELSKQGARSLLERQLREIVIAQPVIARAQFARSNPQATMAEQTASLRRLGDCFAKKPRNDTTAE